MPLKTFAEYDQVIAGKVARSGDDQFETLVLMVQLFWLNEDLWKSEVDRLRLKGGWNALIKHKKADWGVTTSRFKAFYTGLDRLKSLNSGSKHYKDVARKCGVQVVALFGHHRWTNTMVADGVQYTQACYNKYGNNAKLTHQLLTQYIKDKYPEAFKETSRTKKPCKCVAERKQIAQLQGEVSKYKNLYIKYKAKFNTTQKGR